MNTIWSYYTLQEIQYVENFVGKLLLSKISIVINNNIPSNIHWYEKIDYIYCMKVDSHGIT
jgi:hypothetical protein